MNKRERRRGNSGRLEVVLHSSSFQWLRKWSLVLVEFSFFLAIAQLLGIAAGIMAVRLLPSSEYAHFTIANGMISTLAVLAECGIAGATAGIGGRVWQDAARLGQIVRTSLQTVGWLRNVVALPVGCVLAWLLFKNGATVSGVAAMVPLALLGGVFSLSNQIYIVVPRLLGETRFQQVVGFVAPGVRLTLTVLLATIGLLAETALLAIVAGYVVQFWVMRHWTQRRVPLDVSTDPAVRSELASVTRRQLPNSIYFVFQSQISIWVLSIFGSTAAVADFGAVTRLSVIFGVLMATMQGVIIPRYARCQEPVRLAGLYVQIMMAYSALVLLPVIVAWIAPRPLLWVLGEQYEHLPVELALAVAGASIWSLNGLAWQLNANRGWYVPPWINIPVGILTQLGLLLLIGVATVRQVLTVALLAETIVLGVSIAASSLYLRRLAEGAQA